MKRILFITVALLALTSVAVGAEVLIDSAKALKLIRFMRGEISECKNGFQQLSSIDAELANEVRLAKADLGGVRDGLGEIAAATDIFSALGRTAERVFPPLAIVGTLLGGFAWNERRKRKKLEAGGEPGKA